MTKSAKITARTSESVYNALLKDANADDRSLSYTIDKALKKYYGIK